MRLISSSRATHIVLPGDSYRPRGLLISSLRATHIVLAGDAYRPRGRLISSSRVTHIVLAGDSYRPRRRPISFLQATHIVLAGDSYRPRGQPGACRHTVTPALSELSRSEPVSIPIVVWTGLGRQISKKQVCTRNNHSYQNHVILA